MGNATRPVRKELSSLLAQILCFALLFQACGVAEALELRTAQRAAASARSGPGTGGTGTAGLDSGNPWQEVVRRGVRLAAAARAALEAAGDRGVRLASVSTQATQETGRRLLESLVDRDRSDDSDDEAAEPSASRAAVESPGLPPALPSGSTLAAALSGAQAPAGPAMPVDLSQVALAIGPNLISLPNQPPDTDPATVLAPIAGQFTAAFAYDACDPVDPWKLYDPADPGSSDLVAIDHKLGVWIDATAATSLPSDGSQPPVTQVQLCTGWNLIGYPLGQERPVLAALASIAGQFTRVFGFDPTDPADLWEVFDVAAPDWANDLGRMTPGRGYWVLATQDTQLDFENDGAAPEVEILTPAVAAEVASIEQVVGSVRSGLLDTWTLSYRASGASNAAAPFVTLATGNTPVESAALGSLDPTLLLNGMYDLKLAALDFQGQLVETTVPIVVDGQRKVGIFTLAFSDLRVPLSGLDIEILRIYDSRDKQQGDFGIGWALDIRQGTYESNRPPGDGWQIVDSPPPVSFPCVGGVETKSHLTTVRLSDEEIYRFKLEVFNTGAAGGGCIGKTRFAYIDGPTPGASLDILGNVDVFWGSGTDFLVDPITVEIYEPRNVRLRTRDGREFDLTLGVGVTALRDANNNQLQVTASQISHSSGVSISIERDFDGRITRITDPLGETLEYAYDAAGDLVSSSDRTDSTTTYTYDDEHLLLDIFDPLGNRSVRSEYDEAGRLISTTDANGNTISYDRDVAARTEVITNRLGALRVLEYDARGNVVREVDELGNETLRTFDARDNLLSETDPLGRTVTMVYDANDDPVSITDPAGTTNLSFDAAGRMLTLTDPTGRTQTFDYDAAGNVIRTEDPLGNEVVFTFDSGGNMLTQTDAAGQTITFAYDGRGNMTAKTDTLGNVTTFAYDSLGRRTSETRTRTVPGVGSETLTSSFTYDAAGRLLTTTRADGATIDQAYDGLGRVISLTDTRGLTTSMTYDAQGNLVATTFPDGTTETTTRDAEGRVIARTDRAGRTTTFGHDAAGRQTSTTYADGSSVSKVFDAAGQLLSTTDELGNTTSFAYDAAGRRTSVTDALGQTTTFTYDDAGNRLSVTDARGNTTGFAYDALNRPTTTTFPDGTTIQATYDVLGRRISLTDQHGRVTQFGYDALGRLTSVIDAAGETTTTTYDEVGNRLTQTDANGNVTSFIYSATGQQIARTEPGGLTELTTYHPDGTRATRTDFNGNTTVFERGTDNRLSRRLYPDGSEVSFTYTPTGRRATVTDARGVTSYTYDARDRLLSETYPDGRRLDYTYDAAGNRTSLTATVGASALVTSYTYDALNRLETVTDPDGGVYTHGYDAVGNRTELDYPNGVETTTSFDALNRLVDLTTRTGVGSVLQSYSLTLSASGARLRIDEADGGALTYAYDAVDRLTQDRVIDSGGGLVYQRDFTYDAVGNRLQLDFDDGVVTDTISYSYDARDRLLTEGLSASYGWDANGNLVSKTEADPTGYEWDFENRLTGVDLPDGSRVDISYDADGNRVRTEVTDAGGASSTIHYLVDTSGSLSQVVAESDGSGQVTAYYVRGDELLSVKRPGSGEKRYYHSDAVGSIRLLSDDSAVVTDSYDYTAFGVLLDHQGSDPQPYRFAAEPFDFNVLFYNNRARWLDTGVGRFLSVDPLQASSPDPSSLHRYVYVNNRPVDMVDPSGLLGQFSLSGTLLTLTIASIVTNIAISAVAGTRFAVEGFPFSGWLASVSVSGGDGGGFLVGAELDFVLANDLQVWVSPAFFFGFGPTSAFRTSRKASSFFAIGPIAGMNHPSDLESLGAVAVWPTRLLRLLRQAPFARSKAWSLAMHLAKSEKRLLGSSVLVGTSGSGPAYIAWAPLSATLATAVTYNLEFLPLVEVFDRYGQLFEELGVGGVLDRLNSLPGSAEGLAENSEGLGEIYLDLFVR